MNYENLINSPEIQVITPECAAYDEAIDVNIEFGKKIPNFHSTTHLYPVDGEVHKIANHETAWAHRDARWAQVIVGVDPNSANAQQITAWCKDFYDALTPHTMGGAYVNFMMEEGQTRIKDSYKDNYERLVSIKTKYDPTNFFHINQNIKPTS